MTEIRKKVVTIADPHLKMAEDIMAREGAISVTEVLRRILYSYNATTKPKDEPAYVKVMKARLDRKALTPEQKASYKVTEEIAKKEIKISKEEDGAMAIVNQLYGAELIDEPTGDKSVLIPLFTMTIPGHVERGEIKLPLTEVTADIVAQQFDGSKEDILKIIQEKA